MTYRARCLGKRSRLPHSKKTIKWHDVCVAGIKLGHIRTYPNGFMDYEDAEQFCDNYYLGWKVVY